MLNSLTQAISKDLEPFNSTTSIHYSNNQHGIQSNSIRILLDVPSETLTGVTSYLDPPSLLSLGTVNRHLHKHVGNDNTWHRAFVCQFLGIGPESDVHDNIKSLMLRRYEDSWRSELIVRYNLRRRWKRSRNANIAHIPVPSPISSMHLMRGPSLLVSSIECGIISRSFPLTGKVLPGFLDTSGARMGIGNPNAEFTPNVSVCVIGSDGGTVRVLWGFRNGEVAVMTAPKVMDTGRRISTELVRCDVNDEHKGAVLDGLWDGASTTVVTAGADGRVKVWDAKSARCVWTSETKLPSLVPDACVKVAAALLRGYVVGALRSGEIVLWTGFDLKTFGIAFTSSVREVRIACPTPAFHSKNDASQDAPHDVKFLYLDSNASCPIILVSYQNDPYFYRIRITQDNNVEVAAFGDAQFGPICILTPFFSTTSSFVLTGDFIGCVSVYDWQVVIPSASTISSSIQPVKKFEAHGDGASVTALAWNGVTLITGSAQGTTRVWDGLTFEHLRSFASPVPQHGHGAHGDGREREAVSQILVGPEKEVLLVAVGDRVMAWQAGPVGKNGSGGVRGRHAPGSRLNRKRHTAAKYVQQLEMQEKISESVTLLELQSQSVRRANGREREQMAKLESMGLDEAEAVEYVLMLSRDEALRDGRGCYTTNAEEYQSPTPVEEGIFEGDFDDIPNPHRRPAIEPLWMTSSSTSSSSSFSRSGVSTPQTSSRPIPRARLSNSNQKIQVSPPYRPEAMEAQFYTGSVSPVATPLSDVSDESHFPPISASTSPGRNIVAVSRQDSDVNGSPNQRYAPSSVSNSSRSIRSVASTSAWKTPLVKSGAGSPGGSGISPRSVRSLSLPLADMDDDLRLAIDLSLAEARSRGENL